MAEKSAKQQRTRIRKSNSYVFKNGIRKMRRPIKKYAESYRIGLAYMGLVELNKVNSTWESERNAYEGGISKDTSIGTVTATAYIRVNTAVKDRNYGKYLSQDAKWDDDYDYSGVPAENMKLWAENMEGMTIVSVEGSLRYYYENRMGKTENLYTCQETAYSVEDVLDMLTRDSEEAWGEVTIKISEIEEENAEYISQAKAYPDTITIQTAEGPATLNRQSKSDSHDGNWSGDIPFSDSTGISCTIQVRVMAVGEVDGKISDTDYWYGGASYGIQRGTPVEYYGVWVHGTIIDRNTQVSSVRNNPQEDSWVRLYEGEGAESLEGAIAIVESNVAEIYQEYQDYIHSVRTYETISHGRGQARTVENINEWNYNFGDSTDDRHYELWDREVTNQEPSWGEIDTSNGYSEYRGKLKQFIDEYTGRTDLWDTGLEYTYKYNGVYDVYPRNGRTPEYLADKTREDVERACRMADCKLVDFTDGTHFTIAVDSRVALATRKMAKSKTPKSFNDMVQSIRQRNNKRK